MRLKFALGAVVADLHDVLVTVGIFSLLDKEFDLTIVAALLTILGYSLNDTIIVYDRVREHMRGPDKNQPFDQLLNRSVNETLSRTILTAGTTLLTVACLYFFGGGVIHDFALAMIQAHFQQIGRNGYRLDVRGQGIAPGATSGFGRPFRFSRGAAGIGQGPDPEAFTGLGGGKEVRRIDKLAEGLAVLFFGGADGTGGFG